MYDPATGRFPSLDPKGYSISSSRYVYAANVPTGRIDPSGRDSLGYCPLDANASGGGAYVSVQACVVIAFGPTGANVALTGTLGGGAASGEALQVAPYGSGQYSTAKYADQLGGLFWATGIGGGIAGLGGAVEHFLGGGIWGVNVAPAGAAGLSGHTSLTETAVINLIGGTPTGKASTLTLPPQGSATALGFGMSASANALLGDVDK